MNWKSISEYPYYHLPQEKQPRVLMWVKEHKNGMILDHGYEAHAFAFYKDGKWVYTGSHFGKIKRFPEGFKPTHFMEIEEPCTTS